MIPALVLASASPRRADFLTRLGLSFEVFPADVAESEHDGESPQEHTERLAREKAAAVRDHRPHALVLAGDTVVVLDGSILGKPRGQDDAVEMLASLSGRTHLVVSGMALACPGDGIRSGSLTTEVMFRRLPAEVILRYVDTGEPLDKAGAYGIQGLGGALVQGIRGDYSTVVGFPLPLFLDLLEGVGWRYDFGTISPTRGGPHDGS